MPPSLVDAKLEQQLVDELNVPRCVAQLLIARRIASAIEARAFLNPRLSELSDPFLLPNMEAAVERLLTAMEKNERIVVYGDYDVDGVTSLALFTRVLSAFGNKPRPFLPMRMDEGYGFTQDALKRCTDTLQPQLLIAVDCGTSSTAEIADLRSRGIDVIVFDHHEPKNSVPDCAAVVNPKLDGTFGYLASVGIVFKACHALLKRRWIDTLDLRDYLDLVALGTVADLVPLAGENRVLVHRGMQQMANSRWIGIRKLIEVNGVRPPITPVDIGFKLGPRLNAAGRLGTAQEALELLLCDDETKASQLAGSLDSQNRERQEVEQQTLEEAEEQLRLSCNVADEAAIVVGAEGWHPGVVGIVASRLCKTHHRPTLVIGFDDGGIGKGSGRGIEGLSLVRALGECGHLLEKFGGHEMAAGLTIRRERFEEFRRGFLECARHFLTAEQLQPRLRLDAEIALHQLDYDFLTHKELLQPFGVGNPQPIFFARGIATAGKPQVLKEKHLGLSLIQNGRQYRAIFFNGAASQLPEQPWDVAFQVERNEFGELISVQIQVIALRKSEPVQ